MRGWRRSAGREAFHRAPTGGARRPTVGGRPPGRPDCVAANGRYPPILLKKSMLQQREAPQNRPMPFSGGGAELHRELAEVLDGGCHQELVLRPVWAPQSLPGSTSWWASCAGSGACRSSCRPRPSTARSTPFGLLRTGRWKNELHLDPWGTRRVTGHSCQGMVLRPECRWDHPCLENPSAGRGRLSGPEGLGGVYQAQGMPVSPGAGLLAPVPGESA
jgi:hypothetical protein